MDPRRSRSLKLHASKQAPKIASTGRCSMTCPATPAPPSSRYLADLLAVALGAASVEAKGGCADRVVT
jgi:hypothetical protein